MSYHKGFSARLPYDPCAYNKSLTESVAPYEYTMYDGKFENCNRCVHDRYTRPFDVDIVDVESELRNQTRLASNCPSRQYNPNCKKSKSCINTFDATVPVVLAPEVCPIVFNNLERYNGNGIKEPVSAKCKGVRV
jgi:hypothetical protein